jgi:hypothetical protein
MEVDKDELKVVQRALTEWEADGSLTPQQAATLREGITIRQNDRQQIARYFFFIALFCTLLAFGAIFLSEKLLEKIKTYFAWSDLAIALIAAALAVLWFWYIATKRKDTRSAAYEIYMALGGLAVLTSLVYVCKYIHADATYYTTFLSLASISLFVISFLLRSHILWLGALVAVTCWFGAFTSSYNQHYLFLGMNYPVRYVVFGALLLVFSLLQLRVQRLLYSQRITYIAGLTVFFVALWMVSIFGNFNSIERWQRAHQVQVLIYSAFLAIASGLSFYLGIRFRNTAARDFGVLFVLVNLYTRYFEYFWDSMNKGIFFIRLAVTFGLVGRWLERKNRSSTQGKSIKISSVDKN